MEEEEYQEDLLQQPVQTRHTLRNISRLDPNHFQLKMEQLQEIIIPISGSNSLETAPKELQVTVEDQLQAKESSIVPLATRDLNPFLNNTILPQLREALLTKANSREKQEIMELQTLQPTGTIGYLVLAPRITTEPQVHKASMPLRKSTVFRTSFKMHRN